MLGYIASSLQHQFVVLHTEPVIRYTDTKLLHNDNGVLRRMHILHKCMNRPDLLQVLVKDSKFNLLRQIPTLKPECIYAILQVYHIPDYSVKSIFDEMVTHNKITDNIFTLMSQSYHNMPKLDNRQITRFSLYRHFPHVPIPKTYYDTLEHLAVSNCKAFLYAYPQTSRLVSISVNIALNADIKVLRTLMQNKGDGFPIAYWRVRNEFPPLTEINSLVVAYYIRKYDPKYYWSLKFHINTLYQELIPFDMNEDMEIAVDILSRCDEQLINNIIREHENTSTEHWINVLASKYITGRCPTQINIDTCTACKYILERI